MRTKKLGSLRFFLLFVLLLCFHVVILRVLITGVQRIHCFSFDTAMENFRCQKISEETLNGFLEDSHDFYDLMTMYYAREGQVTKPEELAKFFPYAKSRHKDEFAELRGYVRAVWEDARLFPVGKIKNDETAVVSFADSWNESRTFGGDRTHEGCDIMASFNVRGLYPIYSMTDGVVEQIGWLRLGGYRIGIRSDSGGYYYYAHLAEYARDFQIGERVEAGTPLGFMGDTGYSDIPGTTGNFDVHLHMGIYFNDKSGQEISVNSYPILRYLYQK